MQVYEVLEKVAKARSRSKKVEILRANKSGALKDVLRGTYDDRIVWLLPKGEPPPYTPAEEGAVPSNLLKQCVQLGYLAKGGPGTNMLPVKRERIFIDLLESIHPKDAEILIDMVNKKPIAGVTRPAVQEAFPDLLPK